MRKPVPVCYTQGNKEVGIKAGNNEERKVSDPGATMRFFVSL